MSNLDRSWKAPDPALAQLPYNQDCGNRLLRAGPPHACCPVERCPDCQVSLALGLAMFAYGLQGEVHSFRAGFSHRRETLHGYPLGANFAVLRISLSSAAAYCPHIIAILAVSPSLSQREEHELLDWPQKFAVLKWLVALTSRLSCLNRC